MNSNPSDYFLLGLIVFHAAAYITYFATESRPHMTSWVMWMLIAIFRMIVEIAADNDPFNSAYWFVDALICLTVMIVAKKRNQYTSMGDYDGWWVLACLILLITWGYAPESWYGKACMSLVIVTAILPTHMGVEESPYRESPWPWFLWGVAFVCHVFFALTPDLSATHFLYPAISGVMCLEMAILILGCRVMQRRLTLYEDVPSAAYYREHVDGKARGPIIRKGTPEDRALPHPMAPGKNFVWVIPNYDV